jgi:hypothetical protein
MDRVKPTSKVARNLMAGLSCLIACIASSCASGGFYTYPVDHHADWRQDTKRLPKREYTVFLPGISHEQIWLGKHDPALQETKMQVSQWRARRDCELAGKKIKKGHIGWALFTSYGYEYTFLLPPLYDKIVPISPRVAYALPQGQKTFVRVDLTTGEQTATHYTQADGVHAKESRFTDRSSMPFFLARPDPSDNSLMEVTLLGIDLVPVAVIDRVLPWRRGTWPDYSGLPWPDVRYLATRDAKTTGTFLLARRTWDDQVMQRLCDASGFPVTPDLKGIQTFTDNTSQVRSAVEVEPGIYYPMTNQGVAVRPLGPGIVGMRPIWSGATIQGWAVLWERDGGRRWSLHFAYNPWLRKELVATEFFQDIEMLSSNLPTGHCGVAVQQEDGRWDIWHQGQVDVANAASAALASTQVRARMSKQVREEIQAENAERKRRIAERQAARERAEAQRRNADQALQAEFVSAKAKRDFGTMYNIGCALGGQWFVDYVITSQTNNASDIHNALELASDAATRITLQARLRAAAGSYTPQSEWGSTDKQATKNMERTYRENLRRWIDGGNPPIPIIYRR